MLGRCTCLVVLCGLVFGVSMAGAETLTVQWLPSESYAGGKQYDARLDRPVKLWGAGIPVKKAFAEITAQTGVKLACLPPGDDNERICINAYLNPKTPPDLRAVMTQLSWVLNCAFGYTGEGEARVYYLLSTSVKEGAVERIRQLGRDRMRAELKDEQAAREREREERPARWAEFKAALSLSREQAIAKYRGVDDTLLVAMIEPGRRALAEYLARLPEEECARMLQGGHDVKEWASLSAQQQAELRTVFAGFAPNLGDFVAADPAMVQRIASYDWQTDKPRRLEIASMEGLVAMSVVEGTPDTDSPEPEVIAGVAMLCLNPLVEDEVAVANQLGLRRALGESATEEDKGTLLAAAREKRRARELTRREQEMKELLREQVQLSAETRATLSAVTLPIEEGERYTLWQVQEAAAAATGRHVISDCFSQPKRPIQRMASALCPGEAGEVNALEALCLISAAQGFEDAAVSASGTPTPGWEFGEAGQFLRFRSAERDLYRASLPSAEVLEAVDHLAASVMKAECDPDCRGRGFQLTLPLWQASGLAARLTDQQARLAGRIVLGDPLSPHEACRQAIMRQVLGLLAHGQYGGLAALASLTDDQRERIVGKGIPWGDLQLRDRRPIEGQLPRDLTPEQIAKLTVRVVSGSSGPILAVYRGDERVFEETLLPPFGVNPSDWTVQGVAISTL